MIYTFKCICGEYKDVDLAIDRRDDVNVLCNRCDNRMERLLCAPQSSKLMGINEATRRDGKGALVSEDGFILEQLSRSKCK